MSLIAANKELKRLRSVGWKPGMNKIPFSVNCLNTEFDRSLEQIAEIVYYEGLTKTLYQKAAICNIIRKCMTNLRSIDFER